MKLTISDNLIEAKSKKIDIIIPCYDSTELNYKYVDIEFEDDPNLKLTIKVYINKHNEEITDFNFYHIQNTQLVFFRFFYQWGFFDLKSKELKRNTFDMSLDFPFFYLHGNCILIVDDLFAETITLEGTRIDQIANEQPYEIKEFEDYFEFDIIGVEKRKLMKNK